MESVTLRPTSARALVNDLAHLGLGGLHADMAVMVANAASAQAARIAFGRDSPAANPGRTARSAAARPQRFCLAGHKSPRWRV